MPDWIREYFEHGSVPICGDCRFDLNAFPAAVLMDAFGFFDTEDENETVLRELLEF